MRSDALAMVIGHLGQDPKMSTRGGKEVAEFSVAVNRRAGSARTTLWVRVEIWNPRPELLAGLRAGAYVRVMGSLFPDEWKDRAGAEHRSFVVRYPQVLLLDTRSAEEEEREQPAGEPVF